MPDQSQLNKFIHFHIPKTAGNSFREAMSWHAKIIGVDTIDEGMAYFPGLAKKAEQSLARLLSPGLRVLSGHYRYIDLAQLIENLPVEVGLTTFIRHPVKRIISDFVFSSSERHVGHEQFVSLYPTMERYLDVPAQANKYLMYFSRSCIPSIEDALNVLSTRFYFVGMTERSREDIHEFFESLALTTPKMRNRNQSPDAQKARALMDRYGTLIEEKASSDIELYKALAGRNCLPMNTIRPGK